jgi:hypothetical protein
LSRLCRKEEVGFNPGNAPISSSGSIPLAQKAMTKVRLCDAPTALIEATGRLDGILQSIRKMAKRGYRGGAGLLNLRTDRLRRQVETECGDLALLSDVTDISPPPDKITHSVVFVCRDSRNNRETSIQIQLENAYYILGSCISTKQESPIVLHKREFNHVTYLSIASNLSNHYKSPADASRIFLAYCKQEFTGVLAQPA